MITSEGLIAKYESMLGVREVVFAIIGRRPTTQFTVALRSETVAKHVCHLVGCLGDGVAAEPRE